MFFNPYDRSSQRSASVDLLTEAKELDVQPVEIVEDIEEVASRACDAIARPDQDNVELAATSVPHHLIEPRPLGLGSADPVGIFLDDLESALCGHQAQVEQLGLRMLIEGRYPHIKRRTLHAGSSKELRI